MQTSMKRFFDQLSDGIQWVVDTAARVSIRADRAPLASVDQLFAFVSTRSALIAQKKLYGYLKERIGIQYPEMFQDEAFARSISIAKMEIFAASLSDMTTFAVANLAAQPGLERTERIGLAGACYRWGLAENADQAPNPARLAEWTSRFEARMEDTNWENIGAGATPFSESPAALLRWAPISDAHKAHDRAIVLNSMRFAWNEVLQEFRQRLDGQAVAEGWRSTAPHVRRDRAS